MSLDSEHELFRATVRSVLDAEVRAHIDDWEASQSMPLRALLETLGRDGLLGLTVPAENGGVGLDLGYSRVWAQELGRMPAVAAAMSLSVQTDLAMPLLASFGRPEVTSAVLEPALRGKVVLAVAVTEPHAGSDLAALRTRAVHQRGGYRITGEKTFITNGSEADAVLTLCRTGEGPGIADLVMIVVPADLPGVTRRKLSSKLGRHSCDHGAVSLADVFVPEGFALGPPGSGYQVQARCLARERCFLAEAACAQAGVVFADAIAWARRRTVAGRPLLAHQAHAFRLAWLRAELELVRAYCEIAYDRLEADADDLLPSAVAKLRATRLLRDAADTALHLRGADGYFGGGGVARVHRDALALSMAGGADEALLHLLTGFLGSDPA